MSNAVSISGSTYTISGTVKMKDTNAGILDLHVLVYDKDVVFDDFLGIGVTDRSGAFSVSFESSKFVDFFERKPDLYFIVKDAGMELLTTKDHPIEDIDESTPPINLVVDKVNEKLRNLINETPVPGWIGGFAQENPSYGYNPTPNFNGLLDMLGNMDNIGLLKRQQKVVWPEFSWNSEPGEADPKRCYQMFAPDISRLGYTDEGRVYSIICPQQGFTSPHLGSLNVEVTVTGNRGWADESNRELAADMGVEGRIWFSRSAHKHKFVKLFSKYFLENKLKFPSTKENAIVVKTHLPGDPTQPIFPLTKGPSPVSEFPIPAFAKHEEISWSMGHLSVQIGAIEPTNIEIVDDFNQMVLDTFNTIGGNMLKEGNILSWNVWFTAPELVDQEEWQNHADYWRESIDADHGSPDGEGTIARHFDGTPFEPLKELLIKELPRIIAFGEKHLKVPS